MLQSFRGLCLISNELDLEFIGKMTLNSNRTKYLENGEMRLRVKKKMNGKIH